jgi:hypothetical protein
MVADCAMMHGTVLVHTCYTKLVILGPGSKLMRRREFIALLGSAAASWPLAAHAQQPGKMWRIGVIAHRDVKKDSDGLREGLRELGYVEGQNIIIEPRYAEGKAERFQEFAEEMVPTQGGHHHSVHDTRSPRCQERDYDDSDRISDRH